MTGVIVSADLVVSPGVDGINADNPLIGYQTIVTTGNLTATTADPDWPVTNLANPSTFLKWKADPGSPVADEYLTVTTGTADDIDYVGIAGHNFGSGQMPVSIEGSAGVDAFTKVLLHFNGTDASTTFTDETGKVWAPAGNAQIDTAQSKFGGASGLFDGTGDDISTPDHGDFALGTTDFTVDFWFKINASSGVEIRACGQTDAGNTAAGSSFFVLRNSSNFMQGQVSDGASLVAVTGATAVTDTSWHHLALVRSGNSLLLFLDGAQDGSAAFTGTAPNSTEGLCVGGRRSAAILPWNGWIDEFRLSVGVARWTTNFTPPVREHPWVELITETLLPDDGPVLFRFTPQPLSQIRVRIQPSLAPVPVAPAVAAVLYVGKLLVVQRRIFVGHTPIPYGRRLNVANHRSIAGAFLGRIVLSETTETSVDLPNLTPSWYRTYFEPFLVAAKEIPFFFAWRPAAYPREIGFAWLTGDPQPANEQPNGLMQVSFDMAGIVT